MQKRTEVGIVIAILLILAALIVLGVQRARESARRIECMNNMRNLCLGLLSYHTGNQTFPYGTIGNPQLPPGQRWSWLPQLAPHLSQAAAPPIDYLTDSRDSNNWPLIFPVQKSDHKFGVALHPPMSSICPNGSGDMGEHQQAYATYVGLTGIGPDSALSQPQAGPSGELGLGIWGYERCTSQSQIRNKLDQTILLIETAKDRDVWLFGGTATLRWVSPAGRQIGSGRAFGGFHPGVAVTGMADNSVRQLSEAIDSRVFERLATIHYAAAAED